jgi:hypothetical protein
MNLYSNDNTVSSLLTLDMTPSEVLFVSKEESIEVITEPELSTITILELTHLLRLTISMNVVPITPTTDLPLLNCTHINHLQVLSTFALDTSSFPLDTPSIFDTLFITLMLPAISHNILTGKPLNFQLSQLLLVTPFTLKTLMLILLFQSLLPLINSMMETTEMASMELQ